MKLYFGGMIKLFLNQTTEGLWDGLERQSFGQSMPKEDLDEYREGFINYSDICKHSIGVADDDSINKAFENMLNHNYRFSTSGLRHFIIDEKMSSFKWIENIYVSFQQYGESFYLISYRLKLNELATSEIKTIFNYII